MERLQSREKMKNKHFADTEKLNWSDNFGSGWFRIKKKKKKNGQVQLATYKMNSDSVQISLGIYKN